MRCPKQPPAEEARHAPLLQQLGGPGMLWPPYPPVPQPFPPQIPRLGERPSWFQGLVAAVSKEIKDSEKKAAAEDSRKENATAPAGLSVEDEKALVDALKKQKQGVMTMEQVFRELSQKYGRTEAEWKTFFFANYERLTSQIDLHSNVGRASVDNSSSNGSVASRTRSSSARNRSSQSSTGTALSTLSDSCKESDPESESESESESEMEWEELSSSDKSDGSPPRAKAKSTTKASPIGTAGTKPARGAKPAFAPVTDADLRAMAQYRFEHDDDGEPGRYSTPRWREFADRPERVPPAQNHKRTLKAWTCVPRNHKHATAIDRYVEEDLRRGDVAESKPVFPLHPQEPQNTLQTTALYPGARMQGQVQDTIEAKQDVKMGAEKENKNTARAGRDVNVDRMEIIDLTGEKEE
ncbi:hypothetical protein GSI_07725 [Ganoderma sinense ZZ0214-1]|uniref:Uncharacterized protein n=1 Tax=Ganoderma sinense ZZ0214-1 TaxID=1077348 RepID=A0A2G8S8T7_9APHY|nr:hypothetical protein GSI_07725 [Ganoderma sinense ZZ0214-1]